MSCRVFANSKLGSYFKTGKMPALKKQTVDDEEAIPIFRLGDTAYPLLLYLIKEYSSGGSTPKEKYLVYVCVGHAWSSSVLLVASKPDLLH